MEDKHEISDNGQMICLVGYALNTKKLRRSYCSQTSPDKITKESNIDIVIVDDEKKLAHAAPWCGGGLADILSAGNSDGVQFQLWDPTILMCNQPKFDVIVHKLTEDLSIESSDKDTEKIAALEQYLDANPNTRIVDSLDSVRTVVSRELTCKALERVSRVPGCIVKQPNYFIYRMHTASGNECNGRNDSLLERMLENNMSFPVICKPVVGCGTPSSHQMVIIVSPEDLVQLRSRHHLGDLIIQQYHNHDNCFYKVYVIDTEVMVFRRPSLPNLSPELRSIEFDSRYAYPTISDFLPSPGSCPVSEKNSAQPVSAGSENSGSSAGGALSAESDIFQRFKDAAQAIKEEFGLTLFGFDVILPTTLPDDLLVVDVNFFPSYKEVVDFPSRFRKHLRRTAGMLD